MFINQSFKILNKWIFNYKIIEIKLRKSIWNFNKIHLIVFEELHKK